MKNFLQYFGVVFFLFSVQHAVYAEHDIPQSAGTATSPGTPAIKSSGVSSEWLSNNCTDIAAVPKIGPDGKIFIYSYAKGDPAASNQLLFCNNGQTSCSNSQAWSYGHPKNTAEGEIHTSYTSLTLGNGFYTLSTVARKKADGSFCYHTVKITRTGDNLRVETVTDPNEGIGTAVAAQQTGGGNAAFWGWFTQQLNEHRRAYGLPDVYYDASLEGPAYDNSNNVANWIRSGASNFIAHAHDLLPSNSNWSGRAIADILNGWKGSAGHNALLLSPTMRRFALSSIPLGVFNSGWFNVTSTTMYGSP
jgi:hypothetical protein